MKIAGRHEEIKLLQSLINKDKSSFVAVYGRRRIGKTYLVRTVYEKHICFECSGVHQKDMSQQLENFWHALIEVHTPTPLPPPPKTWIAAFYLLRSYLNSLDPATKKVAFLDELPWFETPRSGFLAALDIFWNQYCSKRTDIILVICGSAASWIIDKVINNTGGLHNRLTHRIQLLPFTLSETKAFFEMNQVQLPLKDIAQIYMCVGGVPYYLADIVGGYSVPQILNQLFFGKNAILYNEFQNLYASLFKNSDLHEKIVAALAQKNKGLTRNEIIESIGIKGGGSLSVALEELIQCGFVRRIFPIGKTKEDALFRLIDEYSLFYFKFLKNSELQNNWQHIVETPTFKIWSGYAFENLCFKHTEQIKKAFGIQGIISNEYAWVWKGNAEKKGVQIDLIIDRADNCMNVLEIKFYNDEFEISKDYEQQLRRKINTFKEQTHTKKAVFLTMLSVYGVVKNAQYLSVVTNQLTIDDLF